MGTGVLSPVAWARSAATGRRVVWALDPTAEGGCHACRACRRHATNKIFRTRRAAELGRAHPACGCAAVRLGTMSSARWSALFVRRDGSRRPSVDRRDRRVHAVLHPRKPHHAR